MVSENGWIEYSLEEVTENFDSVRVPVKKADRRSGPYPYYGASGIVDHVDDYIFDGEFLLVAEDGENLRTRKTPIAFIATGQFWVNNHAHIVRGNHLANTRFLAYALDRTNISGYLSGTTMPKLTQGNLNRVRLSLPPRPIQEAIVTLAKALDDKIELNRRMNETLEAMARAIFKSWFVDFDPVRAKLDGRQPPGMDADTAALFPDHFEHVDGEPVPTGWSVMPLPEAVEVNPKRTLRKGDVVPYLDMKNMPTAGHRPDKWIDREFKSGTKFVNGDTLLARITPCLENGKTAFVDFLENGQVAWGSTEYIILRPKPPLPVEFGYYLARSDELRLHAIQNMTGTSGRQRVPPSCFDQFQLAVPPAGIAERFGEVVRPLMQRITASSEQSKSLAATRDALLPKLLSGKIRVSDAETVEAV